MKWLSVTISFIKPRGTCLVKSNLYSALNLSHAF